ncbi:fumarylacetoacetate hydrolase family protein [bacterium]|nr:fumarylacetoacetate hydrolase family protein [bacterium]
MRLGTLINEFGDEQLCYFHENHFLSVEQIGAVFGTFFPGTLNELLESGEEFEEMQEWWDHEADERLPRAPEASIHFENATLGSAIPRPGKIIDQDGSRPQSSVISGNGEIRLPDVPNIMASAGVGLVIRKSCRNFDPAESNWRDFVAGFTQMTCLTTREESGFRAAYDSFLSLGPILISMDEFADQETLDVGFVVSDEVFEETIALDFGQRLADLSQIMTLHPGDVILVPGSTSMEVQGGETLECRFEDLLPLVNPVVAAEPLVSETSLDTE